jgi:biopolymer transport protein ExbB
MNFDVTSQLSSLTQLGAGWIMWLLIALSVLSVAVTVDRTIVLLRSGDDIQRLRSTILPYLFARDYQSASAVAAKSRSYEARVLKAGLEVVLDGASTAEQRMAGATTLARLAMEKWLAFLGTVGANAPFVGLLGTVIGIVRSFAALEASSGKVSASLMSEVGEALIATAIGILVAIPAVAAFNAFQRVIKDRLSNADALARELVAQLSSQRV